MGFEIGYHSEIVDCSVIWGECVESCLKRDLKLMRTILDTPILGIASHGGLTGLNNLDFWENHRPDEFGAVYEAYGDCVMKAGTYVSDSMWIHWKSYKSGVLQAGDIRSPSEIANDDAPMLLYMLNHPDTYFDRHIYG